MKLYNFKNIVKLPTWYKNPENPSCIDPFLTKNSGSFQDNHVFGTGISDFYELFVTVLRTHFKKQEPKTVKYRNYERFNNKIIRSILLNKLMYGDSQSKKFQNLSDSWFHFVNN